MEKLKRKILLKVIDDIINKHPSTDDFIPQKLIEKCDREGISIEKVTFFFLVSLEAKTFLQTKHVIYQNQHMLLAGFKVPFL